MKTFLSQIEIRDVTNLELMPHQFFVQIISAQQYHKDSLYMRPRVNKKHKLFTTAHNRFDLRTTS